MLKGQKLGAYFDTTNFHLRLYPKEPFNGIWFGIGRNREVIFRDKCYGKIPEEDMLYVRAQIANGYKPWELPEKSQVPRSWLHCGLTVDFINFGFTIFADGKTHLNIKKVDFQPELVQGMIDWETTNPGKNQITISLPYKRLEKDSDRYSLIFGD